jgi:hypothetical protein
VGKGHGDASKITLRGSVQFVQRLVASKGGPGCATSLFGCCFLRTAAAWSAISFVSWYVRGFAVDRNFEAPTARSSPKERRI